jgi:hypothetical protein
MTFRGRLKEPKERPVSPTRRRLWTGWPHSGKYMVTKVYTNIVHDAAVHPKGGIMFPHIPGLPTPPFSL